MTSLLRILTTDEARATILIHRAPDNPIFTPEMAERSRVVFGEPLTPDRAVERIIREVRTTGDEAVRRYTRLLDGPDLVDFMVDRSEIETALDRLSPDLRAAMETAAERIRAFHQRQPAGSWIHWDEDGGTGQIVRPLNRVGLYVPGGQAVLFSTLLMAAIPARVAGVREIVVVSPPDRTGAMSPALLAAAHLSGVDTVYRVGGAQAIAALAYGTASIPRVDKILGPGNLFVVTAKRQVFGAVDIDQLPGPTETMLIAEADTHPGYAAADLLAQAEHDPLATAILLTPSVSLAQAVQQEAGKQIDALDRAEIVRASLARNGGIVVTKDIDEAIDIANAYAPEHLCLLLRDPWGFVGRIENAGGVFVGEHSSEALGDYVTGPSHIMPTGGTARFSSPLSVRDFVKIISVFGVNETAAKKLAFSAITLAEAEGLGGHASALRRRLDGA
ncbi:MAG: histidinol dehydrogenase [candidate division Zixibacteria bacterium]|nr:histidinol dehydrogenase [candidate division Zixibacteria bacterium]